MKFGEVEADPSIVVEDFDILDENAEIRPRKCVWQMNEDIVISGIAGRFPNTDNVKEFRDNLLQGVDMITENEKRWKAGFMDLPSRSGVLKSIEKFDREYFKIGPEECEFQDTQIRLLLECSYEAILDAGISPHSLSNTKTAVFVGNCIREKEYQFPDEAERISPFQLLGKGKAMFVNRISTFFNLKGPNIALDTACSSGMSAFDVAVKAMRNGECSRAIVGASQLCLHPIFAAGFQKLGMLSKAGACKVFDADAAGYGRSEGIAVLMLEKASIAKRVYATVIHTKTNTDGRKPQGITFPSTTSQGVLLNEIYTEANIDPRDIAYLECHGTGTLAGDIIEARTIARVLMKDRTEPLLIGSVKSNIGHTEATSGLCSVIKVIIAMEEGIIPANLHFKNPNPKIPALSEGKLKVITENTPWKGGIAAVSGFGFGGVNVHVILRSNQKEKDPNLPEENLKLFAFSGRTSEAVATMLDHLEKNPDHNLYGLLSDLMDNPQYGHPYRGFTVLHSETPIRQIKRCDAVDPSVWFVFPGMGTQLSRIGRDLMELAIFRKSILSCAEILKPYEIDLYNLIMNGNDETFEQLLNSFLVSTAIQIALVDTLRILNLKPDGIVGYSIGELGCAYADNSLTAEQTILSAYWMGKCIIDSKLSSGARAQVGLSVEQMNHHAPLGIVLSGHNSTDSVTISGAAETVNQYVQELKSKNIFVREMKDFGFAFHCNLLNGVKASLLKKLREIIVKPKPRSPHWISSSVPEYNWDSDLAKTCSPEYLVNNLVSPVLFHEAIQQVPNHAILIEIGTDSILEAILTRSLSPDATYVGTIKSNHSNNLEYLLSNIGMMYIHGMNPTISKLYPPVSFPVPRQTPMISPYIKWDHSKTYPDLSSTTISKYGLGIKRIVDVSSHASEDYFLVDHKIDKRVLFPAAGYFFNAWRIFAFKHWDLKENLPVTLKNVQIHRATMLPTNGSVAFYLSYNEISGCFSISENNQLVASGTIEHYKGSHDIDDLPDIQEFEQLPLSTKDIYKELSLSGYEYGPKFQGVLAADMEGQKCLLKWDNNWITFIDSMMHCLIFASGKRNLAVPIKFFSLTIDPIKHQKVVEALKAKGDFKGIPLIYDKYMQRGLAGGVELRKFQTRTILRLPQRDLPILETYKFVPYIEERCLSNLPEFEKKLQSYHDTCVSKINEIRNKLKSHKFEETISNFNFDTLKSQVNDDQEKEKDKNMNETLLKSLERIYSLPLDSNYFETASQELEKVTEGKDFLLTSLLSRRIMKPCLEVIMENTTNKHLKVLELDDSEIVITKNLLNILNEYTDMSEVKFSYTKALKNRQNLERIAEVSYIEWQKTGKSLIGEGFDLIVANGSLSLNYNDTDTYLENLKDMMKRGGFLMLLEPKENNIIFPWINEVLGIQQSVLSKTEIQDILGRHNLEIVSYKSDGIMQDLYLIKKASLKFAEMINIQEENVENWLNELKSKMSAEGNRQGNNLWLISKNEPTNGIIGLTNTLRKEPGGENIRCIFCQKSTNNLNSELKNLTRKDLVMNVFIDGKWGSFRHLQIEKTVAKPVQHGVANISTIGDLSSIKWSESPTIMYHSLSPSDKVCHVYYSSLNFKDIMIATGRLTGQIPIFGFECSGRDVHGKRIMGISSRGALATTTLFDNSMWWNIPDNWTMEEAATVPVVYATVYYAFFIKGNLKPGKSILIHSGAGGIGQAAISVALHLGCTVYTTVGTQEKREFLKQRFPVLKDNHISNSRDLSFEKHIMKETNGIGVDFVLNSLAEDKLIASLNCVAENGSFLEIGKFDVMMDSRLGMSCFQKNISFHAIFLDQLYDMDERNKIREMVTEGIQKGAIQPLNRTIFDKYEVEEAVRYMATGKHIGKVILKIRDEEKELQTKSKPIKILAEPKFYANPEGSYIITGGLGGFGLELTEWLITRKAKHIMLSSRSGVKTAYQSSRIYNWRKKGINIIITSSDITTEDGVTSMLQEANSVAPVTGIFHLAMVLKDGLFENQTIENFQAVINPKVTAAKHLDKVTRNLCPTLENFVVFSSIACGRGNVGQSNYAFANSSMERICELRRKDNLPGLAIQWGAVGDVGIFHELTSGSNLSIGGIQPQRIDSCLAILDQFLKQDEPVVSSFVAAGKKSIGSSDGQQDIILIAASILGVKDPNEVDGDLTLGNLGIDSLMAVELQQIIERDFGQTVSLQEIRDLTLNKIKEINIKKKDQASESTSNISEKSSSDRINQTTEINKTERESLLASQCLKALNNKQIGEPMFIIHGFEGNLQKLQPVISMLNCPVFGIECTKAINLTSLTDIVSAYIKEIQAVQPKGPYCLAGYTFGITVALQIAMELQKKQETISYLILLDINDPYSDLIAEKRNNLKTDEDIGIQALCHFFSLISEFHFQELLTNLKKMTSFEERVQSVMETLKQRKFQNVDEIQEAAKILLGCLRLGTSSICKKKYQGDALILNMDSTEETAVNNTNHMQQIINGRLSVKSIEGSIETLTTESTARKFSNLINDYINM